jgi:hypothetical protein
MSSSNSKQLLRIAVSSDGKRFYDKYTVPVDISSNVKLKVRNNKNSNKKVYAYLMRCREKS